MGKGNLIHKCIGMPAMLLAMYFSITEIYSFPIFVASLFLFSICLTDTLYKKIPNELNLILVLLSCAYHVKFNGIFGIFFVFGGIMTGVSMIMTPYLMKGIGAGDVKALGALGATMGATAIFQIFLYTSLIGGVFAILFYILKGSIPQTIQHSLARIKTFLYTKDFSNLKPTPTNIRFPYAAAIAFGYFAYIHWGNLI
jgi:prepilin peptidase CpaA